MLVLTHCGVHVHTPTGETVIGRHSSCDLRLTLGSVSRRHCKIGQHNGRWTLTDLDSTNGTFINGERMASGSTVHLDEGDTIQVGDVLLYFERLAAAA